VRLRALAVTTALALAATGLSACTSKIGQAATYDGHRLSASDVSGYVKNGTKPYADQQSGTTVDPLSNVVATWLQDRIISEAYANRNHGEAPSTTDVRAALAGLSQGIGSDAASYFKTTYDKLGYTPRYSALVLNQQELVILLAHTFEPKVSDAQLLSDLQSSQALNNQLVAAIGNVHAKISVAGRYGAWDAKGLTLSTVPSAGLPSFVTIGSDAQAAAAPAPAP
jgi:hypothetical protein